MLRTSFLLSLLAALLASDEASSSRRKTSRSSAVATVEAPLQPNSEKEQIIADARHKVFSELSNL